MVAIFTFGNSAKFTRDKIMLFTKCRYAMNTVFSAIRRDSNKSLHLIGLAGAHLSEGFSSVLKSKTILVANVSCMQFCISLRREFLSEAIGIAETCQAYLLTSLRGMLHSQTRASHAINIETLTAEWFELIQPVLFTGRQGHRQHEFHDFKGKSIGAILVPSILQLGIMMNITTKLTEVREATNAKICGTANVELVGNST